ncbi:MAG TPA: LysR family transcriptional regulator, partial [Burkholderiales bacterium]|nr:LysR family transcriptional regulator [Burkholderiales bacterium]
HILSRLRAQFDDPLLVRTTRGMEPTPRALALIDPVRQALRQVHQVFNAQAEFDARTSEHAFSIRMGDMNEFLVLPSILLALEKEAPSISATIHHLTPAATVKALDSGEVDFAVSARLSHSKSIRSLDLLQDKMVCILRKDHPFARRPLTAGAFLKLRHINFVQALADTRFADGDAPHRHPRRNVVLNIPHWLAAPAIVESTDMVAAISERMARRVNDRGQFVVRPLPIGNRELVWRLYWHRRYDTQPAHVWMRDLVRRACAGLNA